MASKPMYLLTGRERSAALISAEPVAKSNGVEGMADSNRVRDTSAVVFPPIKVGGMSCTKQTNV